MQRTIYILIFTLLSAYSCRNYQRYILPDNSMECDVIYQSGDFEFMINSTDLKKYCYRKDNGNDNDFTFRQVINYIEEYHDSIIFIPDTLGTELRKEREVLFTESDSLVRVRDQDHEYNFVTDELGWAILHFARRGKLKIFDNRRMIFLHAYKVDRVTTDWYGETNIVLENDSIIHSKLRWIN